MPVFGVLPPIYKKDVILNMKYEYSPKRRTEQERRDLTEQILRLLQSEACEQAGVTDEDIFNRYTGDGGLLLFEIDRMYDLQAVRHIP